MEIVFQNHSQPERVLDAIIRIADETVIELGIAVAYTTLGGSQLLVSRLSRQLGQQQWNRIPKSVITCFDHGTTEPAALRYWKTLENSDIRIHGAEVLNLRGLSPVNAFHPKLFYFRRAAGAGLILGSANLTRRALTTNVEMVSKVDAVVDPESLAVMWGYLHGNSVTADDALIDTYEGLRRSVTTPTVDDDLGPAPIGESDRQNFWDLVSNGSIIPRNFDCLWIEAGTMSSGGSHNQLELPRGASAFFGFAFNSYGAEHAVIAEPILRSGPARWTDKSLTWHGHNYMERINLPTITQGGFEYSGQSVLFRRLNATEFEIIVEPWDSDAAIAWRNASSQQNLVFSIGRRGQRICGLF